MSDLYCPYCDTGLDVCHDDGFGYEEDQAHEMQCSDCDKNFVFHTHISFDYHPEKADCLNGYPHLFIDWRYLWTNNKNGIVQDRYCRDCGYKERRTVEKDGL